MARNIFYIDFKLLAERISPPNKRAAKLQSYIKAMLAPLETFNVTFRQNIDLLEQEARYNGQRIVLEGALNYIFNEIADGIGGGLTKNGIIVKNNSLALNGVWIAESTNTNLSYASFNDTNAIDYIREENSIVGNVVSICVPTDLYNALAATDSQRETIVRQQTDKYIRYGVQYNVLKI